MHAAPISDSPGVVPAHPNFSPSLPLHALRLALALGVAFLLIYLAFLPPGIYSLDGNSMLNVAESLVTRHSLAVDPGLGIAGRGGQIYSSWYPLQSFLAVPLVALAVLVAGWFHVPFHFLAAAFVGVLPAAFTAATVGLVVLLALQLGSSLRGARRAALSFALGTVALAYTRTFYAEPLLMLLATAGLYFAFQQTRRGVLAACVCALLAVLAKPAGILVGPTLSAYLVLRPAVPRRLGLLPGIGAAGGLLLYMLYNWTRFGNPFVFGQPYAFSLAGLPLGVTGLLLSPGRGLLWYCPPVIAAGVALRSAFRTRRFEALCIVALFGAFLTLHSLWVAWSGGWSWGPRFLVPVLPGVMAAAGLLEGRGKRALLALTALGFLISAPTLVSYYERYYAEMNEQGVPESELLWSPSHAPLLHAWSAAAREVRDARRYDVREIFAQRGTPSGTISKSRALRVVALWWWVLPVVHISRTFGAAVSLLLLLTALLIIFRARPPEPSWPA